MQRKNGHAEKLSMNHKFYVCMFAILTIVIVLYFVVSWIDGSRRLDRCECVVCDIQETDNYDSISYVADFCDIECD